MLRLTPGDLITALAGLSVEDRQSLLRLLQQREAMEAEAPIDDRQPLAELVEQCRREHASRTADPEARLAADAEHQAAVERHMQRLMADRSEEPGDIAGWLRLWREVREQAVEAASAAGHLPPGQVAAASADEDEPDVRLIS
jgi:hypothetical protein